MINATQIVLLESTPRGLEARAAQALFDYPRHGCFDELHYEVQIDMSWQATVIDLHSKATVAQFSAASCRDDLKAPMNMDAINPVRLIKVLQTYHPELFVAGELWYFVLLTPLGGNA